MREVGVGLELALDPALLELVEAALGPRIEHHPIVQPVAHQQRRLVLLLHQLRSTTHTAHDTTHDTRQEISNASAKILGERFRKNESVSFAFR